MNELVGAVLTRPAIDAPAAAEALAAHWGIRGVLRPLPSERDRNFAVSVDGQDRFVLKIANAAEDPAFLDLQHRALERLAAAGVPCQRIIPAGEAAVPVTVTTARSAGPGELAGLVEAAARYDFDLAAELPVRSVALLDR